VVLGAEEICYLHYPSHLVLREVAVKREGVLRSIFVGKFDFDSLGQKFVF